MVDLNSKTEQQADDAITWLARNVHEWPEVISGFPNGAGNSAPCTAKVVEGPAVEWKAFTPADGIRCFSKQQWLARRTVLQNKPSWDDAPEWATYLGQSAGGDWEWFSGVAEPSFDSWEGGHLDLQSKWMGKTNSGEVLGDWRDTLERRPKNNLKSMSGIHSHGDMASLLNELDDNDNTNPEPSSSDWHKRGDFPPIGTECEILTESEWSKAYVVGFDSNGRLVCHFNGGCHFGYRSYDTAAAFRPLQTERERVAAELVDVMLAVPVSDRKTASESFMSMALAIYDHLHPDNKS